MPYFQPGRKRILNRDSAGQADFPRVTYTSQKVPNLAESGLLVLKLDWLINRKVCPKRFLILFVILSPLPPFQEGGICQRFGRGVAGPTRLELATSDVTGQRSNQLNYGPAVYRPQIISGNGPIFQALSRMARGRQDLRRSDSPTLSPTSFRGRRSGPRSAGGC